MFKGEGDKRNSSITTNQDDRISEMLTTSLPEVVSNECFIIYHLTREREREREHLK